MKSNIGIHLNHVNVNYPLFDAGAQDLQRRIMNLVSFRRIQSSYTPVKVVHALKDITFKLEPGNSIGLIGRNGAGKSTLLRIMSGILDPSCGEITRRGRIAALLSIGAGMEAELNGYQNIYRLGLLRGLSAEEVRMITPEIVEFAQLGDFINLPTRTYSSGMRMRLAFAIATVGSPDILLIDEVFGVGDNQFQNRAKNRINELLTRSKIVVISSHANSLIREFCVNCLYLANGEIRAYGPTSDIMKLYQEDQKRQEFAAPATDKHSV